MSALLAGCLLLACGRPSRDPAEADGGAPPSAWARSLCRALDQWIEAVDERSERLGGELAGVTSLLEARNQLIAFLDDLMVSTDRLLVAVDGAGYPAVDRGRLLAADLRRSLTRARTVFREGRRRAAYVSIEDQPGFQAEATALSVSIQAASRRVDESIRGLSRRYPSNALDRAFAGTPACQGLNVRS